MIRSLRQRHRWIFAALALLLPSLLVAALALRKTSPVMPDLQKYLPMPETETGELLRGSDVLLSNHGIRLNLYETRPRSLRRVLEVRTGAVLSGPDPLLYWYAGEADASDQPPEGAYLLGVIGEHRRQTFLLPEGPVAPNERVILYSLGHQTVIAEAMLSDGGSPQESGGER